MLDRLGELSLMRRQRTDLPGAFLPDARQRPPQGAEPLVEDAAKLIRPRNAILTEGKD
jgi:hypothetical protein